MTVACTVKVSQQASFTPLVRDVDPALFPGADQDTRPETITAKTNRIFVVGKRITQRAADGKNYSRALETYATHYYQVACGSAVVDRFVHHRQHSSGDDVQRCSPGGRE